MWIKIAGLALLVRLLFIFYISKDDNYYEGVFSNIVDIDHKVYLDASLYESPYMRHTYRYSPILSWLVSPSYQLHQLYGRIIIAFFDFITIAFIYKIFANRPKESQEKNNKAAKIISYLCAFNPVVIYITVRGSCEGITMALAAAFWYFYFGGDVHGNMSPI
jgi:phosphatidylinositol glycan class M